MENEKKNTLLSSLNFLLIVFLLFFNISAASAYFRAVGVYVFDKCNKSVSSLGFMKKNMM